MSLHLEHKKSLVRFGWVLVTVLLCGSAFVGWMYWPGADKALPTELTEHLNDPRIAYKGPFQNISPDVHYVGDSSCLECHEAIVKKYHHHPMGRSLKPMAQMADEQTYSAESRNPFNAFGSQFSVERQGNQVWHREKRYDSDSKLIYELSFPVDYVIGSGNNGHSYLTVRDGFIFQTPISWYSQKKIWDSSPGFDLELHTGRPLAASCLFCHANQALAVETSVNHYEKPYFVGDSIGCERCHGPGEKHIAVQRGQTKTTGIDYSIVNPKHLEPNLREAICQQCHLEGEARIVRRDRKMSNFRPGLPLTDYLSVFVQTHQGEDRKAVNHVEQMYLSKCFIKSAGKMGCITCHDPHEKVPDNQKVAHYRSSCRQCHEDCSLPRAERLIISKENSCIDCHMTRFSSIDIAHTASTNHQILKTIPKKKSDGPHSHHQITTRLVLFPNRTVNTQNMDEVRDLGLALTAILRDGRMTPTQAGPATLDLLQRAVTTYPRDVELWEAKAQVLEMQNRVSEALAAYETVLTLSPQKESAVFRSAAIHQQLNQREPAIHLWRQLIELNPWRPQAYQSLARLLATQQQDDEVLSICEKWLTLDPSSIDGRQLRITCLLRKNELQAAEAEFNTIERLGPANLADLKLWFHKEKSGK